MRNGLIDELISVGFTIDEDEGDIGEFITTLGENEELRIFCYSNYNEIYVDGKCLGVAYHKYDLSKLLKEKFRFPFDFVNYEMTNEYLEDLGFSPSPNTIKNYRWESMFSQNTVEVNKRLDDDHYYYEYYDCRINKEYEIYGVEMVNDFEWFLECHGILRMIK